MDVAVGTRVGMTDGILDGMKEGIREVGFADGGAEGLQVGPKVEEKDGVLVLGPKDGTMDGKDVGARVLPSILHSGGPQGVHCLSLLQSAPGSQHVELELQTRLGLVAVQFVFRYWVGSGRQR